MTKHMFWDKTESQKVTQWKPETYWNVWSQISGKTMEN